MTKSTWGLSCLYQTGLRRKNESQITL